MGVGKGDFYILNHYSPDGRDGMCILGHGLSRHLIDVSCRICLNYRIHETGKQETLSELRSTSVIAHQCKCCGVQSIFFSCLSEPN